MKILKRILLGFLSVLGGLVVLLVGSVAFDYAIGGERIDKFTNTIIPGISGGPAVKVYIARPQGAKPYPTVIMIHEFFGLNESIIGKADALAAEGYLVIAPDTFRGSTTAWIPRAIYQVITNKAEQVNADLDSVFLWLETQPDVDKNRIGIVGFCYGGRTSLNYSLHNNKIATSVVFYGSPITDPLILKNLPGPLLGIFGGADQSISVDSVHAFDEALTQAGVQHDITIYPNQPHAFVQDMQGIRSGGAQAAAWEQMLKFLNSNLKNSGSSRNGKSVNFEPDFDWKYYVMLTYEHAFGSASHMH